MQKKTKFQINSNKSNIMLKNAEECLQKKKIDKTFQTFE